MKAPAFERDQRQGHFYILMLPGMLAQRKEERGGVVKKRGAYSKMAPLSAEETSLAYRAR